MLRKMPKMYKGSSGMMATLMVLTITFWKSANTDFSVARLP